MRIRESTRVAITLLATCGVFSACRNQEASAKSAPTVEKKVLIESPTLTDGNIVALLEAASEADSTLGAQAQLLLSSKAAKAYAQMMMHDHHQLREKVLRLATRQKITADMPKDDPFATAVGAERSAVRHARYGRKLDSTYIANEIEIHSAVVNWVKYAESEAHSAALVDVLRSAEPELRKHLDHAAAMQHMLVR